MAIYRKILFISFGYVAFAQKLVLIFAYFFSLDHRREKVIADFRLFLFAGVLPWKGCC